LSGNSIRQPQPQEVRRDHPDIHHSRGCPVATTRHPLFSAEDLLGDALVIAATTKAGEVSGDQPVVRCPFVDIDRDDIDFVPEGDEIDTTEVDSREAIIATGALAVITVVSVDQHGQPGVSTLLSNELRRAMTEKADAALLSQPAPSGNAITPPPGLLNQDHETGGTVDDDLDAVVDGIAAVEADGGQVDLIIASPQSWAAVSKLKQAEDSNMSLLGPAGVAAERVLLSVPVLVNAAMPSNGLLLLEKRSVLSAYSALELANSEHSQFRRRSIETRLWWRIGAVIARPERVIALTVAGAPAPAKAAKTPAKG
jgi:HK97 family phage major capsid protein